ncbi:MAG: hypothetical protein ACRD3T_12190 [Terriglobia bacterium]
MAFPTWRRQPPPGRVALGDWWLFCPALQEGETEIPMKKMWVILLLLAAFTIQTSTAFAQKKEPSNGIMLAGTTEGNVGCAILEKHMPVKGKLLFAGIIYARTEYKVIQTFNAKLPKQKYTGSGEVKKLNQFATQNKIKLVVIPSKYTPDQLQQATADCKQ